ncbi:hypothetical protein MHYP_G00027550 [Metynnis hypsauchen]
MEELSVMGCSQFNVELKTLVDALLGDVCALAARWSAALQQQISASHSENQELRRRLHLLEETLSHRTRRESVAQPDTQDQLPEPDSDLAAPGSYHHCKEIRAECATSTNMETDCTDLKAGQLSRIKEEEVEISVTGRAVHRVAASHIDVLHTTTDTEENSQLPELKTEIEGSAEREIREPESEHSVGDSEDDAQDSLVVDEECEAEDQSTHHGHLSPPKTEEEDGEKDEEQEQFGTLPLLTSDLQHNSIPLPNNSTSSDCSMFVMLEGNTNVPTTGLSNQYSSLAGRASGPSKKHLLPLKLLLGI